MEDQKMNKEWCSLGSSEDIFFLFLQGTNCKVKASCFNERIIMNLLVLTLAK